MRRFLCALLALLAAIVSGCSYIRPSLDVESLDNGGGPSRLAGSTQAFVTRLTSCLPTGTRAPTSESLTRQLFIGWDNIRITRAIEIPAKPVPSSSVDQDSPQGSISQQQAWKGHVVRGRLEHTDMVAVAVRRPAQAPDCVDEVIAFSPTIYTSAKGQSGAQERLDEELALTANVEQHLQGERQHAGHYMRQFIEIVSFLQLYSSSEATAITVDPLPQPKMEAHRRAGTFGPELSGVAG